jgi:hypothetical protein
MHANLLDTTLRSIAQLEVAREREPRLTEPDHARWLRFYRKPGWRAFIEILHEDLAGAFPVPFDLTRWLESPRSPRPKRRSSSPRPRDPSPFQECLPAEAEQAFLRDSLLDLAGARTWAAHIDVGGSMTTPRQGWSSTSKHAAIG